MKEIIESINEYDEYMPNDLYFNFMNELMVATFICPVINDKSEFLCCVSKLEGIFIPVFTSMEEYDESFGSDIISFKFSEFKDYLNDDFKGIMVNPNLDDFFISKQEMSNILDEIKPFTDYSKRKSNHKISELETLRNYKNESLNNYLKKYPDILFEDLVEELSKSILYTYMVGEAKNVKDSVLKLDENELSIFLIDEFNMECCLLFTDEELMEPSLSFYGDIGGNIYSHVINLELMTKFVLELDLDAIIVNYAHQNILIPRKYLFNSLDLIIDSCDKYVDNNYSNYAFLIDEYD